MSKPKKIYDGLIPFDIFGGLMWDSWRSYRNNITDANLKTGKLLFNVGYDYNSQIHTYEPSFFTHEEIGVVMFSTPKPPPYNNDPLIFGEYNAYVEVPNYIFTDQLRYTDYSMGNNSFRALFVSDITGRRYSTFATEFNKIVPIMEKGVIKGDFTFCKRGSKYGFKML